MPLDKKAVAMLIRRVDEVLFYIWDPIGVKGEPNARDEYESYAVKVVSLLVEGKSNRDIEHYLMNQTVPGSNSIRAEVAVSVAVAWHERLLGPERHTTGFGQG